MFFFVSKVCEIFIQLVQEIIKLAREREREMEARQIGENGLGRKGVEGSGVEIKENEEVLKNIIASHPLYEVLIESHINCFKAGMGLSEGGEFDATSDSWKKLVNSKSKANPSPNTSELDHFMEAYCMGLRRVKEAIEEATKESNAFIGATYVQLKELDDELK